MWPTVNLRAELELQKEKEGCRLKVDARRRRRLVSEKDENTLEQPLSAATAWK